MGYQVHDEESLQSVDNGKGTSSLPSPIRWGCFWLRILPPIRWILKFFKWLFLSNTEWELLQTAKKLYKVVNVEQRCCCACPYEKLGKLERMYLHRVLRDEQRFGSYEHRTFVKIMREQVKDMQRADGDAGADITEDEFTTGVLYASMDYIQRLVDTFAEEIKKEYKKDEEAAEAS
eukprot:TRINITY_DN31691_c0_g1_i1.p1 TRINITY_DN31691_c0_g1~~TRINITY_DN31691_c0_g1_i1.p1  ORF type:complete len:176 (+),score=64.14 TRINITY_DN31691_c0_g1_i1:77-604(+)